MFAPREVHNKRDIDDFVQKVTILTVFCYPMREFHSHTYGWNCHYAWLTGIEDKYLRLSTEWSFHVHTDINSHCSYSHCLYRNTVYCQEACEKSESLDRFQAYVGSMRDSRVIKDDTPPAQDIFYTVYCISQVLSIIQKSLIVICDLYGKGFFFTATKYLLNLL